jgi:hypothetical protein
MMPKPTPAHAVAGPLRLGLVALLSLPAVQHVATRSSYATDSKGGSSTRLYEDEDGVATEESLERFFEARPKPLIHLSIAVGLGAAVSGTVLGGKIPGTHAASTGLIELGIWVG